MQTNFSQRLIIFLLGLSCLVVRIAAHGQPPAYVPDENLVAWYGFAGDAMDASINGNHGAAVSVTPTTDRSGNSNSAYFFNGVQSEIVVPFNEQFNAFPFTVSLWCKLESDDNGSMLIQRYTNSSWNGWVMSVTGTNSPAHTISPGYMLQAPPNCNGVVSSAQCGEGINYTDDFHDHLWHMLTFTVDGDSGRFYVDGAHRTSQAWVGPAGATQGSSDLRIGGTDMGAPFFFHGALDDVGVWNRALTSVEIATLYNTLPPVAGCTNTNACNYTPEAIINDGSCEFDCSGCIDPCACNYNQNAAFNDGSCDYSCNVGMTFITVFHDANSNGSFDSGENPMQYWPVKIVELQKIVYTDYAGMILVPLPEGVVHYQLVNNTADWVASTPSEVELVVPGNTQAFFGLQHVSGLTDVEVEEIPGYYGFMHCEHGVEGGVYVRNTGGQLLHGTLTLICDPQFIPTMPQSLSTPPNVAGPGFAQWDIQNLNPWETRLLAFHIAGPGSDWDGLATGYSMELEIRDALESVVYANTFNSLQEIRCDEQPARLQSDPIGYDDAFHYVPQGSGITFRAQFQNNTTEWAEDVLLIQNLNSQQFDVSSFELLYASEAVVGCLHDDGTIDLQFSNLMVAPSDVDATQSGGFAVYRARLRDDIPADSTFYHNMHVVLDLNNTASGDMVYHTIYDCSRIADVIGDELFCEGDTVVLQSNGVWIDEYRWLVGDTLLSTEPQLNMAFEPGFYNVVCQFSNPVCYVCEHKPIQIMEAPQADVVFYDGQLISMDDLSCQWYWNGSAISGATQPSFHVEEGGVYQVQWTSPEGCTAWSEQYVINSVGDDDAAVNVFPNPAATEANILLPPGLYELFVYDGHGKRVRHYTGFDRATRMDVSQLTPGLYTLVATQSQVVYRSVMSVR